MAISSLHDANHLVIGLDAGIYPDIEKFPIGSVWWYSNPYTKKSDYTHPHRNHDFTTSRPVIIMSRNISFSNQLIVIQRNGTMTRPGFDSYLQDKSVDDKLVGGRICPYDIKSVGKEYLTEMIGFLKPELFAAVQKAFAWHLGLSDEIPPYMIDLYTKARYCNDVTYGGMEEHLAKRAQQRKMARDNEAAVAAVDDMVDEALQQAEDFIAMPETKPKAKKTGGRTSVIAKFPESEKARIGQMKSAEIIAEFKVSRSTAYRWKLECEKYIPADAPVVAEDPIDRVTNVVANAFAARQNEEHLILHILNGQKATPFQIDQLAKRITQSKRHLKILSDDDAKIFIQMPIEYASKMHLDKTVMIKLQNDYLNKLLQAEG